jgi:hypothetical protein
MDLDGLESMCEDCRVVGLDGKLLGWSDGLPTEAHNDDGWHF